MDNMTTRQQDVDRRLRDRTGVGLIDWLAAQRASGTSYGVMARKLFDLTGDSVSYEGVRKWCERFDVGSTADTGSAA